MRLGVTDGWLVGGPGASGPERRRGAVGRARPCAMPLDGGEGACRDRPPRRPCVSPRTASAGWCVPDGDGVGRDWPCFPKCADPALRDRRPAADRVAGAGDSLLTTLGVLRADGLDPGRHRPDRPRPRRAPCCPVVRAQRRRAWRADLRALVGPTAYRAPRELASCALGGSAAAYVDDRSVRPGRSARQRTPRPAGWARAHSA
jgi:hypothetical protein